MPAVKGRKVMTTKAILRDGEELSIGGYDGEIIAGQRFDFAYDQSDNFYIIIDHKIYKEVSTAFNFVKA